MMSVLKLENVLPNTFWTNHTPFNFVEQSLYIRSPGHHLLVHKRLYSIGSFAWSFIRVGSCLTG